MPDKRILRATFQKHHTPYGVRVHDLNLEEIGSYEDCRIMRDGDGRPLGVEVKTTEGSLDIGINRGWIFEDSDGKHYPISDEAVGQMYTVSAVHESAYH